MNLYFADAEGWRLLVTPWPMLANEGGLKELSPEQLAMPHYAAVKADAERFYRSAGGQAAVLLYRADNVYPEMVGSFWLQGPFAKQS